MADSLDSSYKQELLASLEIQAQALRTLTKEIYENIGQVLALAKVQLHHPDDRVKSAQSGTASSLISQALRELRDLARQPNPGEVKENGFANSIAIVLKRLERTGLYETSLAIFHNRTVLDDADELVIFCILQDIILQLVARAEAGTIKMRIDYQPAEINILVSFQHLLEDQPNRIQTLNPLNWIPDGIKLDIDFDSDQTSVEMKIKKSRNDYNCTGR